MLMLILPREKTETRTRELCEVHDKVTKWKLSGRFNKIFHSREHAETLKSHEGAIETALEELQVGPIMCHTL